MSEFIWYWNNGNRKIFTKNTETAEKALKKGIPIFGKKIMPDITRY